MLDIYITIIYILGYVLVWHESKEQGKISRVGFYTMH